MRSCLRSSPGRFQVYSALLAAVLGSFVRVAPAGAEPSDVLDKKVKASGYPVLGGPFWASCQRSVALLMTFSGLMLILCCMATLTGQCPWPGWTSEHLLHLFQSEHFPMHDIHFTIHSFI